MLLVVSLLALLAAVFAGARALIDHATLKRRLREFETKLMTAEKLLAERGLLASELAHEIKNPISAILCSAQALDLLIGKNLEIEHRRCLKYIEEYGENLLKVVGDFLDLSRSESRQLSAQTETVCVKESLDSILGLLNSTFIKRQLEVRKVYAEEELLAVVDPRHLKQILFNLLHNSSKFTADGGQITVMTRSNFPKHEVAIEVRDTGCGIDRSRINEIFDPYSRAARSEDHEGFGLGLAVCKALIELNGGEIRVESEPGVGSSFQVTFRRAERERAIKATKIVELPNDNLPLASQNFLLVGVPPGVADSMAALIRALGGAVEQVQAAKDAVQALGDRQFSAIMVDQEPGEEKAEPIAQALKANHLNDVTSLIVSTNDQAVADQALKSGADQAILKPVSGQGLIEVLLTSSKTQLPH